ncbi:hypothetical protein B0H13DRAFT_2264367 [Mycena leptocephala]|nr:hypothetical protein B0H13DRAFT_2264367 [Mycena leptocephala]
MPYGLEYSIAPDTPKFSSAMPPVREKDHTTTDKTLKLGENLCKVLNLQDRRPIFIGIQRVIHQRVDQHFDLCRPSYEQQKKCNPSSRRLLQPSACQRKTAPHEPASYAGGYLDDKLVELSANEVLRSTYDPTFSNPKKAQSFETLQPASLPKGDIIKVIRPQPRPLRRSHKKKEPAVEVENSVMDVLPIESDPLEHEAAESSEVDESDYSVIGPKRRVSFSVPVLSPSPEPPSPTSPVTELLEIATDLLRSFLKIATRRWCTALRHSGARCH